MRGSVARMKVAGGSCEHPEGARHYPLPSAGSRMGARSWKTVGRVVRLAVAAGVVAGTTAFATFVRPDATGLAAGLGFGLVFAVAFVWSDWVGLGDRSG